MTKLVDVDSIRINIKWHRHGGKTLFTEAVAEALEKILKDAPPVDAEPVRHGHIEADGYTYTCSVCESRLFEHDMFWRYCPYCGARLEDEEECENT